ncbi:MAG: extracellular solute-binding protein [Eubacterium sp.]|nr:extracellular solute-binding protein [Eubacterium sp.]
MKTRIYLFLAAILCAIFIAGCAGGGSSKTTNSTGGAVSGTVDLVVWGGEEDEELMNQIIRSFEREYQGQADFNITFAVQGESNCKDKLIGGLEEGADVFTFADDQLNALAAAGALNPVENAARIREQSLSAAVSAASVGDDLYAYPLTADNGYFMYYNKKYFSEKDVRTLEKMLQIAAEHRKKLTMDWSSAWYVYSFFGNTGLKVGLNDDGITNYCTWNSRKGKVKGVDVAEAMLGIAKSSGFSNKTDTEFVEGVKDGSVIAGISGVWNAVAIKKAWGENMGAAKLPVYTCAGQKIQMASFSGCKLIGVNAYSKQYQWASRLAEWITNEENQALRFQERGQGPANIRASETSAVRDSPAINALLEQSEFSQLQRVGGKYWDPVADFAKNLAAGNPSGKSLQQQMDKMTEKIMER